MSRGAIAMAITACHYVRCAAGTVQIKTPRGETKTGGTPSLRKNRRDGLNPRLARGFFYEAAGGDGKPRRGDTAWKTESGRGARVSSRLPGGRGTATGGQKFGGRGGGWRPRDPGPTCLRCRRKNRRAAAVGCRRGDTESGNRIRRAGTVQIKTPRGETKTGGGKEKPGGGPAGGNLTGSGKSPRSLKTRTTR